MKIHPCLLIGLLISSFCFSQSKKSKQSNELALSLYNSAVKLYDSKNIDSAIVVAQNSFEEFGKLKTQDSCNYNLCVLQFGMYYERGNAKDANRQAFLGLEEARKIYGEKSKQYVTFLGKIVNAKLLNSELDTALIASKYAIDYCKNTLGTKNSQYAYLLFVHGMVYHLMGNYPLAETNYKEGLKLSKEINDLGIEYIRGLRNLGEMYRIAGNLVEAEKISLDALDRFIKDSGENTTDVMLSQESLGQLYVALGNLRQAENYFIKGYALCKKIHGKNSVRIGMAAGGLGKLYFTMGNYPKSEQYFKVAIQTQRDFGVPNKIEMSSSLSNLGLVYRKMKKYSESEKLYLEALEIQKKNGGASNPNYAIFLGSLAQIYNLQGRLKEAEKLLLEVIKLQKEKVGEKAPDYLTTIIILAQTKWYLGDLREADSLYAVCVAGRLELLGPKHQSYVTALGASGNYYSKTKRLDIAEPYFLNATSTIKDNLIDNFSFLSEKEKELYFKTYNDYFSRYFDFCLNRKTTNPAITGSMYNTLLSNKGMLLRSSTAMRHIILESKDTVLIKEYNRWSDLRKEISKLNSMEVKKRKKNVEELEKTSDELEKNLVQRSSELGQFESSKNLVWQDIQKHLKKDEAAIEFIHFNRGKENDTTLYCALVIRSTSKAPEMIQLFEERELKAILGKTETGTDYITSIYGQRTKANDKLYNLIWKPLEKQLKGVKTIDYSPSGLLHKISFATLGFANNTYLCNMYQLNLQSSTSKVAKPENLSFEKGAKITVYGNIIYDTPLSATDTTALVSWPYLEGTKVETEKIAQIIDKSDFQYDYVSGIKATEEQFKLSAPKSNIIHIATHGFFFPDPDVFTSEEKEDEKNRATSIFRGGNNAIGISNFVVNKNPLMRSGLVFAGANDVWIKDEGNEIEDGVVTAQEVTNMDLRKTSMAVLSACETGLGDIKETEGVYGLQRSLKMAGVKYIIMSLWQVPDAETVEFMEKLYSKFVITKNIRQSFKDAQKDMSQKYDPFYWAAFVLLE